VIIAVCVQPIQPERSDDADWDLHRADEIFDIGTEISRVFRRRLIQQSNAVLRTCGLIRHQPRPIARNRLTGRAADGAQRGEIFVAGQHTLLERLEREPAAHRFDHLTHVI